MNDEKAWATDAAEDVLLKKYGLIRLSNVQAPPFREWLCHGVLGCGSMAFLCGKPGVGKSALAKCLIAAHLRGEKWLGFSVAKASRLIIWLGFEEDAFSMREPFRRMGFAEDDIRRIVVIDRSAAGSWSLGNLVLALNRLRTMIKDLSPSLVVIDPLLNLTRPKDSNQYEAVKDALDPVLNTARETGAHILGLVHAKKGDYSDVEAVLGSIGFAAAPDKIMLHTRRGKRSFLSNPKTRDTWGTSFDELELIFDPIAYTVSLGAGTQKAQTRVEERIVALLATDKRKRKDLFAEIKGGKEIFDKAFNKLEDAGDIEKVGGGFYALVPGQKEQTEKPGRKSTSKEDDSPSQGQANKESTEKAVGGEATDFQKPERRDGRYAFAGAVPGGKPSRSGTSNTGRRVPMPVGMDQTFLGQIESDMKKEKVTRLKAQVETVLSGAQTTYDEVVD